MVVWLLVLIAILLVVIIALSVKVYLLEKSADEICDAFAEHLSTDTNTLIDISCRDRHMRRLASDINKQLRKLRDERRKFQQGDMEVKEAVTNISHDLRTPLTAICGYLDLMQQEEKSETLRRYLDIIENRTLVMKQLTEELFRYSVVTSTIDTIHCEDTVVNAVLEECISSFYAVLKSAGIHPDISICENKIVRSLDKNAALRIFSNIISNAVKYSDGDLSITLDENGEIVFSNHASKLDKIQSARLLNRFYTVENAEKSTGIGLSIAKSLTEKMNGSISVDYSKEILRICILFK